MFVLTMGRGALRRAGAALVCMMCIAGALAAAGRFTGGTVAASASVQGKMVSTQDMADFFTGYGLEVDQSTASVDEVKIPRKWNEDFKAFNAVVAESGYSLEKVKGKKVEKWTMLCPGASGGDTAASCVLLLYKKKPVGAYLLTQPGGEVSSLPQAQQTAAALAEEQAAREAAAEFGTETEEAAAQWEETEEVSAEWEEAEEVSLWLDDEDAEAAEAAALEGALIGEWPAE